MIETELGLLEMQRELVTSYAMKLRQPMFGMAPKRLDAVDVSAALDEFVAAVIDPKVRYRYSAGIPWRDLPERLGDFRVIHLRHSRWSKKSKAHRPSGAAGVA